MSVDPTQQQPPPGDEPYIEYGSAGHPNFYSGPQDPYRAAQGAYDPYSAPQTPYPSGMSQAARLPLGEATRQLPGQYWRVLTRPGPISFAQEAGKGGGDIVLIQLIAYTIIDALLGMLRLKLYPIDVSATTSTVSGIDPARVASTETAIITFISGPGLFILVPLAFYVYQGIAFGIARAANGQGTLATQSYATLLFFVPLGILVSALDLIPVPFLGGLIGLALIVYGIVLSVFAMMGTHRLSGGKASAAALLPLLGVFLLACCALFFILVIAIGNAAQ